MKANGSNLVDLSHQWHERMPQPAFFPPMIQEAFHTIEKDGVLSFYNHLLESCGTHCEAPAHMLPGALTIEKVPLAWLIGPAVVINVRDKCKADPNYKLSIDDIESWETKHGRIPDRSWLIMFSGWSEKWGSTAFFNTDDQQRDHYPGFDAVAMKWLVKHDRHIVGIATECVSPEGGSGSRASKTPANIGRALRGSDCDETIDRSASETTLKTGRMPAIPVRDELLPVWNTLVLSSLANVRDLPEAGAWIIVGVIPFRGGSGGQARVFGVLPVL